MTDQQPSGIDLARVALANAKAAAKAAPPPEPKGSRTHGTKRTVTTGGDPVGLGAAVERFMRERGWEPAAAGGSIMDRWATIAPELLGKVSAEHYDSDTGTLHLRPHVDAYGTHLRLKEREVVDRINAAAGGTPVRALRILPTGAPGRGPQPDPAPAAAPPPAVEAPARPRETTPDEYRQARAAVRASREKPPARPPVRTRAEVRENASDGYKQVRAIYLTNRRRAA